MTPAGMVHIFGGHGFWVRASEGCSFDKWIGATWIFRHKVVVGIVTLGGARPDLGFMRKHELIVVFSASS